MIIARRVMAAVALGLLLVAALAASGRADSFVPKDFDQLVAEADQIFTGTVVDTRGVRLSAGLIVTDVTFAGIRLLKGSAGREITLRFLGGTVGNEVLEVGGWPRLDVGQAYVVFTKDNGRSIFPVVGGDQGLFQVASDPRGGGLVVRNAHGQAVTSSIVSALSSPGLEATVADGVPLDVFLLAIRDRLAR